MVNCFTKQKQKWDGKLMIDMDCPYCQKYKTNNSKEYDKHMMKCINVNEFFQFDIDKGKKIMI